ncbi:stage V sporulation protein AA [Paenibacillus sp. N1-5-1-14]|uniref:stage V sporulation protein AA n=1 Tax=Paenibacillus radicibacter TaxID=2972488 RepID=UPI002158A532|nr:stage V sporulation protein AA [Paenibacillus radicibacter]MCR8642357.1 stage V sporulation protein AA [Paenibacillus radicibacter]
MRSESIPILYIRLRRRVQVPRGKSVQLGDIAQMITRPEHEQQLKELVIYKPSRSDGNRVLVDMMRVIQSIKEEIPRIQIEHFGEPHTLLEIATGPIKARLPLIILVWLLLFIGAGLTIMNFHADVSMLTVHQRIYEMLTGQKNDHPLILQIPYSIGIGVGMMIFFNHIFKKRFNEEPSPLELEMYNYQENINQYVITEEYHKIHESRESE